MTIQPELLPDEVWVGRHPEGGDLTVLGPECYIPPNEKRVKYTRVTPPAEAHGDMVEKVAKAITLAMHGVDELADIDENEREQCYRMAEIYAKAAITSLHQLTEDAKEAYEEGWRNGNSHQGELEYPHMTMQYDWNVSNARALNRPVGGEK